MYKRQGERWARRAARRAGRPGVRSGHGRGYPWPARRVVLAGEFGDAVQDDPLELRQFLPAARRRRIRRSPSAAASTTPGPPGAAPRTAAAAAPARGRPAPARAPRGRRRAPERHTPPTHHHPGRQGQGQPGDLVPGPPRPPAARRPHRPRDPALIAKWISYTVINTERQEWKRGAEAAYRYRQREGGLEVPYEHAEGAYPLGRWLSDQRRAYRAGQMTGEHAAELEKLGIVWDTADAAFAENPAAARAYFELHGTRRPARPWSFPSPPGRRIFVNHCPIARSRAITCRGAAS
ncbi:helicase associated domain-containing protein, partial [Streptomyces sp. NPDC058612]|uniref:helicase associated domain-containing protein n=1 Tax=Streptomyces sp. NPDC058612 TaxID=3346555 RepID=UPI003657C0D0